MLWEAISHPQVCHALQHRVPHQGWRQRQATHRNQELRKGLNVWLCMVVSWVEDHTWHIVKKKMGQTVIGGPDVPQLRLPKQAHGAGGVEGEAISTGSLLPMASPCCTSHLTHVR